MKYFYWFKGFIFIALACSFTVQGSTIELTRSKNNIPKNKDSKGYSISISASENKNSQASANLTISGESSKVTIEKEGTVTLVAGKSIILHPGTKISNGSFLYASIEPLVKSGKYQKKEIRLVTIDEKNKIDEQIDLSVAYYFFSPFPIRNRSHIHTGDSENESFTSSGSELSGLTTEQQRKMAFEIRLVSQITFKQMFFNVNFVQVDNGFLAETTRVLRL